MKVKKYLTLFLSLIFSLDLSAEASSFDSESIVKIENDSLSLKRSMSEILDIINRPVLEVWGGTIDDNRLFSSSDYRIWSTTQINPYDVAIKDLPDSVMIDCSDFCFPTDSRHITSRFGIRGARFHSGVDIGVKYGDTIRASFSGCVRLVRYDRHGYGRFVLIRHDNGLESLMGHMSKTLVQTGDSVYAGQPVGLGGSSGRSSGPHLHYELRFLGNAFNPTKLIAFESASLYVDDDKYMLTIADTYSHKPQLDDMAKAAYHKVRAGETLSHIARRYGTSVRRLCSLNHMKETSILQIGQRIRYR